MLCFIGHDKCILHPVGWGKPSERFKQRCDMVGCGMENWDSR